VATFVRLVSWSWVFSNMPARAGDSVSEFNAEIAVVTAIVTANCR